MAGLALTIITLWLLRGKENIFTGIPMAFMITTTLAALVYLSYSGVTDYMRDPTKVGLGVASSMNITPIILEYLEPLEDNADIRIPSLLPLLLNGRLASR